MENLVFGTYNVSNDGLTISYNAPSILPKETMDKISFNSDILSDYISEQKENSFDGMVKVVSKQPITKK